MKHCMLDIETLGTTPGSIVLSIGAVAFELDKPQHISVLPSFFVPLSPEDSVRLGLRVELGTVKWWMTQRPETLKAQLENPSPVVDALVAFTEWLHLNDCKYIWGNSASFDCGLLGAVYKAAKVQQPWNHRDERCYRTVVNLCNDSPYGLDWEPKDEEQSHNPVYDAQYQVQHLWKAAQQCNLVGNVPY